MTHSFAAFQSSTVEILSSSQVLAKANSDGTWLPGKPLLVNKGIKSSNFLHTLLTFSKTLSTALCLSLILQQKFSTISRDWLFHSAGRLLRSYFFLTGTSPTFKLSILYHFTCNTTTWLMYETLAKLAVVELLPTHLLQTVQVSSFSYKNPHHFPTNGNTSV